jgi:hypothetical protein
MFFLFWFRIYEKKVLEEKWQGLAFIAKFLEVIVNDEDATLFEHNKLCSANHDVFSKDRKPKRRLLITTFS